MLSLRVHLIILAALFAALLFGGAAAGVIHGLTGDTQAYRVGAISLLGGLTAALAFSAVPVMVQLVMGAQRPGREEAATGTAGGLSAPTMIVWAIWLLMGLGLLLAVPAAILDGAFSGPRPTLPHQAVE